ncbi:MAG: hypothetical protein AABX11_04410 [Nanoarchaeota archaeon]
MEEENKRLKKENKNLLETKLQAIRQKMGRVIVCQILVGDNGRIDIVGTETVVLFGVDKSTFQKEKSLPISPNASNAPIKIKSYIG